MTRPSGSSRTSGSPEAEPPPGDRYPSLRQRNPIAYWVAILGVLSMLLGLVATTLSAFL